MFLSGIYIEKELILVSRLPSYTDCKFTSKPTKMPQLETLAYWCIMQKVIQQTTDQEI